MDTRITGTGGIGYIQIMNVIKDTNTYAEGDPFAIPEGHTRYFIRCAASNKDLSTGEEVLKSEDVPYAQYRLYFYDSVKLNAASSNVSYTDSNGKKYKKDVYAAANIVKVGYLNGFAANVASTGLKSSNVATGTSNNYNKYTVEQMGTNCVRIGSPFTTSGSTPNKDGKGEKFQIGNTTNFYIEFEGDPKITEASFGHNGVATSEGASSYNYKACPMYKDEYNDDGTPTYNAESKNHVNIYGASLYVRHYEGVGTPDPEEGGDS